MQSSAAKRTFKAGKSEGSNLIGDFPSSNLDFQNKGDARQSIDEGAWRIQMLKLMEEMVSSTKHNTDILEKNTKILERSNAMAELNAKISLS